MRSHGGVETMLEDKTFLFWKPTSFKSHETRILSGGICFGLRCVTECIMIMFYRCNTQSNSERMFKIGGHFVKVINHSIVPPFCNWRCNRSICRKIWYIKFVDVVLLFFIHANARIVFLLITKQDNVYVMYRSSDVPNSHMTKNLLDDFSIHW